MTLLVALFSWTRGNDEYDLLDSKIAFAASVAGCDAIRGGPPDERLPLDMSAWTVLVQFDVALVAALP